MPSQKRRHGEAGDAEDADGVVDPGVLTLTAATMPRGMASSVATTVAMSASWSDSAKRSAISSAIGDPVHIDRPRSSRRSPVT